MSHLEDALSMALETAGGCWGSPGRLHGRAGVLQAAEVAQGLAAPSLVLGRQGEVCNATGLGSCPSAGWGSSLREQRGLGPGGLGRTP